MDVQVRAVDPFYALTVLISDAEEEKKGIISMLGKIYISANSKTEKLQSTIELVTGAIDDRIAQDAPSRNALNRLHSALSKAFGEADKAKLMTEDISVPAEFDGLTDVQHLRPERSILADREDVRMNGIKDDGVKEIHILVSEGILDGRDRG